VKFSIRTSCVLLAGVVITVSATKAQTRTRTVPRAAFQQLTGVWKANDGGTYQIRQEGTKVWWYGRSPNNGRDWQNVFYGTVTNNQLAGEWADLPPGGAQSGGSLQLQIDGGRLTKVLETGGFGGSEWTLAGEATIGGGASIGDLGAELGNIHNDSALPNNFKVVPGGGKSDSVVEIPISGDVVAWFNQSAPVLEDLLRRLAGDEAVRQYLNWEQSQHPNNLQRVDLRLKAINKVIH
jgi:hypothetical protein